MKFRYLRFIIGITLSQVLSLSYASINILQEDSQALKRPTTAPMVTSEMAIQAYHSDSKTLEAEGFTYKFLPEKPSYGAAGCSSGFKDIVNRPVESINIVPAGRITKSEEVLIGFRYAVQGEMRSGFNLEITPIKKGNLITAPMVTSEMAIQAYHSDSKTLEAEGFTYKFLPEEPSCGAAGCFSGFKGIVNRPVESINIVPTGTITKSEEVLIGFRYAVQGGNKSGFNLEIVEPFPTLKEIVLDSIVKNIKCEEEINEIIMQIPHDLHDSFYYSCQKILR